jgi:hypothetical protein
VVNKDQLLSIDLPSIGCAKPVKSTFSKTLTTAVHRQPFTTVHLQGNTKASFNAKLQRMQVVHAHTVPSAHVQPHHRKGIDSARTCC